jgi:hypothetical protein
MACLRVVHPFDTGGVRQRRHYGRGRWMGLRKIDAEFTRELEEEYAVALADQSASFRRRLVARFLGPTSMWAR